MNYRHAFHAGNFADLAKHAILTHVLRALTARPEPLTVIDTHAGAGLYDLSGDEARRTREAGVDQLMDGADAPSAFDDLKNAVRRVNDKGARRYYPGSPLLIAHALRARDRYLACELHPDDHAALKGVLPRQAGAEALKADGWRIAAERSPATPANLLLFIDPPFERPDDHARALAAAAQTLRRNPAAVIVIWLPIKDLTGLDDFLGRVEDLAGPRSVLVAETRLRPLSDPMTMNGCAVVVINPSPGLEASSREIVEWVARRLGGEFGEGRVSILNGKG